MAGEYGMNMPYQPPQGYGMNYYQPQAPQAMQQYQTQMEARLKGLEQRLYGQPNQQGQPNQTVQPQMNQSMQPSQPQVPPAALFMVSTLDEAQNYAPDFNGTRQVFYIENEPDKLGMKQFNIGTGAADFSLYEKVKPQDATSPAETVQIEPESKPEGYLTDDDLQPIRCQISGLEAACNEIKEMLEEMKNAKLPSAGADDGAKQSAGRTADAADSGMEGPGGESAGDSKQPDTGSTRKSNAAAAARKKPE